MVDFDQGGLTVAGGRSSPRIACDPAAVFWRGAPVRGQGSTPGGAWMWALVCLLCWHRRRWGERLGHRWEYGIFVAALPGVGFIPPSQCARVKEKHEGGEVPLHTP